jgi:tetratricopeptide (TPR) repeat protein
VSHLKRGAPAAAAREFEQIRTLPGVGRLAQVHFLAGLLQSAVKRFDQAAKAFENALRVDATYAAAWLALGAAAARSGDAARAAEAYERYLGFVPASQVARRALDEIRART